MCSHTPYKETSSSEEEYEETKQSVMRSSTAPSCHKPSLRDLVMKRVKERAPQVLKSYRSVRDSKLCFSEKSPRGDGLKSRRSYKKKETRDYLSDANWLLEHTALRKDSKE